MVSRKEEFRKGGESDWSVIIELIILIFIKGNNSNYFSLSGKVLVSKDRLITSVIT